MGVMRFRIEPADRLDDWPEVFCAFISGADGRVFPTRVEADAGFVGFRRQSSDSGKLHVAWPVQNFGRPVISTSSLRERDEPYLLAVELARGKLGQIRDQAGAWEVAGMVPPDLFYELSKECHKLFAQATARQDEPVDASRLADEALIKAHLAAEVLTAAYTAQRLNVMRRRSHHPPAAIGCHLGASVPAGKTSKQFLSAFNVAAASVNWGNIEPVEGDYNWAVPDAQAEWGQLNKLSMHGGPLLDFSPGGLPNWLANWKDDIPNMQSFACDFVETAISRYLGKIRIWEVSSRANTGGALGLNEEARLSLAARTLEVARSVDDELQLVITIDQPWGDYQARGQHRLSPMQFVDALVRSGVGLSAVNLELAIGYRPRGTGSRDLLDFSRLIDQWSLLGIPLYTTLAFPADTGPDKFAAADLEIERDRWKEPWNESAQANWIDQYVPLLMAKQAVVGVLWTHFGEGTRHEYPHAGLIRTDGTAKPALESLIGHRKAFWKPHDEATSTANM